MSDARVTAVPRRAWRWLVGIAFVTAIPLLVWGIDWPEQTTSASSGSEQARPSAVPQTVYEIPLRGENQLSGPFNTNRLVPGGWDYRWSCPDPSVQVYWADGDTGPCMNEWGLKGGEVRFSGPAGEVVTIHVLPPS